MNLDFLQVGGGGPEGPVARSPIEPPARAAGARYELRDGWNVAVSFGAGAEQEAATAMRTAGWADVSHLGKLELQGPADALDALLGSPLPFGTAVPSDGAWWCRLTGTRALVVGDVAGARERAAGDDRLRAVDVTTTFAAITLAGALAREVFARFCALDLRPHVTPVRGLRPGSIGRQPGILIREARDRYLFLFGWATGEYMWSVVTDAGEHLGGRPIGVDALAAIGGGAADPEPAGESAATGGSAGTGAAGDVREEAVGA